VKTQERVRQVTGTLDGERVGMTIDAGALAKIMMILTDLYSDPEAAVVREYSTNALDAHVEAGVTRPIEVTTPSNLSPYFKVRDYGVGMDATDIREVYSRYGKSTKDDSNDLVGMLGLGSKSALTYTDQFTVRGIKFGVCTEIAVSRDADGAGTMTIVDEYETDEESGVEIVIPTKRYNLFEEKARKLFRFWTPGTVLVNGEEPKQIDGMWIADDLLLSTTEEHGWVVMGNVPYPLEREWNAKTQTIAFVPIGTVSFTPSREQLQMTPGTKAAIDAIKGRVATERNAAFQRLIDEAPSKPEALKTLLTAKSMGFDGTGTYKGVEIPLTFDAKPDKPHLVVNGVKSRYSKGWSFEKKVQATLKDAIWFYGYDGKPWTPYKRLKLNQWLDSKGLETPEYFVLMDRVPNRNWIEKSNLHKWSEVAAQKIVRENVKRNDGRPSGSYEGTVCGLSQSTILAKDIDVTRPLFYRSKRSRSDVTTAINALYPDATLVVIGDNRINKLVRDFPHAQKAETVLKQRAQDWADNLTHEERLYLHFKDPRRYYYDPELNAYDASKIDDPDLAEAVRASQVKSNATLDKENKMYSLWTDLKPLDWTNPIKKYDLLTDKRFYGRLQGRTADHVYLYLNAAYAADKEETE
jgi:hypothetical protein